MTLAKGQWGRLLILGGSSQLAGAAVLNTLGALRTGLDLVVVAAPERAANAVLGRLPEAVSIPLAGRHYARLHMKVIDRFASYPVVMGSGMTVHPDVQKVVKAVLKKCSGPFVIDADAIRMVTDEKNPAKLWKGKTVILTPNRQEYAAMNPKTKDHPSKSVAEMAARWEAVIFCKGPTDIISDGQNVVEMPGGSQFLGKAGSGDLLTGIIGALLSRGVPAFDAAKLAQTILKDASLRAEKTHGPGMLVTDVADLLDLRRLAPQRGV